MKAGTAVGLVSAWVSPSAREGHEEKAGVLFAVPETKLRCFSLVLGFSGEVSARPDVRVVAHHDGVTHRCLN